MPNRLLPARMVRSAAVPTVPASSGEQIGLGNQSSALVGVGLIGRDVDGLLAQTLNETEADGRIFDQKSGRIIPPLELHDLFLQRFERKAATHHLENVNNLFANQQNDTCGIIAGLISLKAMSQLMTMRSSGREAISS